MAKAMLGAHALSLEELVAGSLSKVTLIVEDAAVAKAKQSTASTAVKPTSAAALSSGQSRAAVIGALNQTLQGAAGLRPEVAGAFVQLLSSGTQIALPAAGDALISELTALASTVEGQASGDAAAVSSLTGPAAGIAGLAVFGAQACLSLADAVSAVSVEALQASGAPYEAELNDAVRGIAGQTSSAANLRLLLEGSQEAGKAGKPGKGKDAAPAQDGAAKAKAADDACAHIASLHGAAAGPIVSAVRIIGAELNATPAAVASAAGAKEDGKDAAKKGKGKDEAVAVAKTPAQLHAQPLLTAVQGASAAVDCLMAASWSRWTVLRSAAGEGSLGPLALPPASTAAVVDPKQAANAAIDAAVDLQVRVDELLRVLAGELACASEAVLRPREALQAEALQAKEKAKAAAAAAREAADAAKALSLPPEERAKFEAELAKRKDKAAKRAAEEGQEGQAEGQGAANPLGLANGTHEFLTHIRIVASSIAGPGQALSPSSVLRALSPYFPYAAVVGTAGAAALGEAGNASLPAEVAQQPDGTAVPRADALLRRVLERLQSGGSKRKPKVAKGARDYGPEQMEVREQCFNTIRSVFKRHGASEIDTPVFELKETLLGKYGEEGGKLIYDLADQGGELLSLRYDLTVPFARYLALHGVEAMKRYHIAKVYRRDNPQISKGRYREFYQCDYDVAGVYAPMMPDAEVLKVAVDILSSLPIGDFAIKLNHRKLLDAMLDIAGVPASKFRPICSAIDKLDKEPWAAVKEEMVLEKGLSEATADKIGLMVQLRGEPKALLETLKAADSFFAGHAAAQSALADLTLLFKYLDSMGALPKITFDLSLARGLDYYTGVIYEAVLLDPTVGVGSIAAGGRYDNLVGMFAAPGTVVPCVGVSIGVERVFAIMEAKAAAAAGGLKKTGVQVLVASIPSSRYDMVSERMKAIADLWGAGLSAEMLYNENPKLQKQMTAALEGSIPYIVILAEDELDKGLVQVKDLTGRAQVSVERTKLVDTLLSMGARVTTSGVALAAAPNGASSPSSASAGVTSPTAAGATTAVLTASSAPATPAPSGPAASSSVKPQVGTVTEQATAGGVGRFSRPAVPIDVSILGK